MNAQSIGLIIFALIALGAVFSFIFVLGGPEPTGEIAGNNKFYQENVQQTCTDLNNCQETNYQE